MFTAFMHGWFLCLGVIMPLGVQNVFVFNQGAQHRRWRSALPTVLAAGFCDSLLILAAIGGISVVVVETPALRYGLAGVGFVFLAVMGWLTWRSQPEPLKVEAGDWPARRQLLFAASVSLLNPHAIIDTVGVVGPSSLAYQGRLLGAYTAGCLFNSWSWFLALMSAGHWLRKLPSAPRLLRLFNKVSALIIWGCALLLAWNAYKTSI